MDNLSIRDQIIQELDQMPHDQQAQLLLVAKRLRQAHLPKGTPGEALLAHMKDFTFAPGALDEMMRVIEEDCERIDWGGWE